MARRDRQFSAFSLIELLIVISLISLLAGLILPHSSASIKDQLQSVAESLSGDLANARSLAVANNSIYRITFDLVRQQYVLRHAGTNPAFHTLPPSPFHLRSDAADQHTVRLADLPHVGQAVRIFAVYAVGSPTPAVTTVDFGPLGETTRSEPTVIWLACGASSATRFLSVRVNPVNGLCWIENFQASAPSAPASGS